MAPGVALGRVGPTVHDVRGAPVPGLSGVAPRPVPGAVRFEDLLRGLAPARPGRPPATPPVQRRLPLAPGAPHAASPPAGSRPALVAAIRRAGGGRVARARARAAAGGGDPTRFTDVRRFLPGTTQGYVDRGRVCACGDGRDGGGLAATLSSVASLQI